MSYDFQASGRRIAGTFASTYNLPLTLAAWCKFDAAAWAETSANYLCVLSSTADEPNHQVRLQTNNGAADRASAQHRDTNSSEADSGFTDGDYDDTWVLVVGTYVGVSERNVFVEDSASKGTNTTTRGAINDMDLFYIGAQTSNAANAPGLVAEVGVWNIELSDANIDALQTAAETGVAMNTIATANNIGYWPLDADSSTHLDESAVGGGPTLTVTNAVYSSDHPTIAGGGSAAKSSAMRLFM